MPAKDADADIPDLPELNRMIARFAPSELNVNTSALSPADRKALPKLIEAARVMDEIFLSQFWSGNPALRTRLRQDTSPLGKARLHYFEINKGPWSAIDGHTAFLPGVPPRKLPGANFYPEDMTKQEFEAWSGQLPATLKQQAEGFFSVIRRDKRTGNLRAVPYSEEYAVQLQRAARLLREAAALTTNASLKKYLTSRAEAFSSNDYYQSDIAWMDLDAPLDVTIGPYETYNDELFGYKAAFEAYVNLRDDEQTARLKFLGDHLQEVENNLPVEARHGNPKLGAMAPIRVVNEIFAAGDAAHGVRTAAYNLPNDERVVRQKGSKRVMLKNIQEAKFRKILEPIAARVLRSESQSELSFDQFFTHILAHELSHGIGPHQIKRGGKETTPRMELKDLYSAIEEAKADVTALFMLQHLFDSGKLQGDERVQRSLYTTFLASAFRTLRFGLHEAHGKGMALQLNYMLDKGAFVANQDGTFRVEFSKIKSAVRNLTHELLMIEAEGDYAAAKKMLDQMGVVRPEVKNALERLKDIPTDIEPIHVTAALISAGK